jgi:hypothetical protein
LSAHNVGFTRLNDRLTNELLGGRPRDPRVKYATGYNRGKTYAAHPPKKLDAETFIDKVEPEAA